jgi:hypothetical protein
MDTIRFLADPELGGRGFGTPGLERAADFIASQYREAGLEPGGDTEGSYFQSWSESGGEPERQVVLKNVVGVLRGTRPDWAESSVVVGAHYDHLGTGWPDVREAYRGQVHPGADDNASGIALLLELARVLTESGPLDRSVVFVAFAGEEAGRRGSKHYLARPKRFPANAMVGMINLDTVGRLGAAPLTVFGTSSAREWAPLFIDSGNRAGITVNPVVHAWSSSDQQSFLEAGIPAVQLFSGPNADYHRPSDTVDKIDAEGLTQIAAVLKEVVEHLATRERPLTATLTNGPPRSVSASEGDQDPRKVSLGSVPDFAYDGSGVRLTGTLPGSPAERAGLESGDVIVGLNGKPVANLHELSSILKMMHAGDRVSIRFAREGGLREVEAVLVAR